MIKFLNHIVFPLLVSGIIASMVALTLYFSHEHGRLYLLFMFVPAILTFLIYRKEEPANS